MCRAVKRAAETFNWYRSEPLTMWAKKRSRNSLHPRPKQICCAGPW